MPESLSQLDPRVLAHLLQIFRLCVWLVLLSVIFTPLERLFAVHPKKVFRKDVAADLFYYFLSSLTPALALGVPLSLLTWGVMHYLPAGYLQWVNGLPIALRALLSLVIGELGFYWGHRWSHELPVLWSFHAVHHSAEHMDFLVNTRAHPVDIVFTRLCGLVPMYMLGLAAPVRGAGGLMPVIVVLIGTVWGFFIHSNVRWRLGRWSRSSHRRPFTTGTTRTIGRNSTTRITPPCCHFWIACLVRCTCRKTAIRRSTASTRSSLKGCWGN